MGKTDGKIRTEERERVAAFFEGRAKRYDDESAAKQSSNKKLSEQLRRFAARDRLTAGVIRSLRYEFGELYQP